MERPKLELDLQKPLTVKLLYDDCIQGNSKFGNYFLYAVSTNGDGKEYSLFAPEQVHNSLKNLKRGDSAIITKIASQKGNKLVIDYTVESIPSNGKSNQEQPKQPIQPKADDDFYYSAMEKSFDDAFKIQQKFNGVTNISQVAISIFIQRTKGNHNILN